MMRDMLGQIREGNFDFEKPYLSIEFDGRLTGKIDKLELKKSKKQ